MVKMFTMKRKSGTIRKSQRPADLDSSKTFLDMPSFCSVFLVDDIEKLVISVDLNNIYPYTYKIEDYPFSHHTN